MGIRKTTRVAKAVGAGPLVDYASSKIAKYHLRNSSARKYVEDKTSGMRAGLSAAVTASTVGTAGAGALRLAAKKAAPRIKGNIIKGMSDRKARIQDNAIMQEWAKRKKK